MRDHNAATCRHCESVPPGAYRRHWMGSHKGPWHVIADGPDLAKRLPRQAHYCTVLAYAPGDDGTPGCYRGPLYAEWDEHDPAADLEALIAAIRELTEAVEVMLRPKPRPQPDVSAPTGRAQIQVNARFDREIIADAMDVLVGVNDPPTLFMRGSEFVQVTPNKEEAVRFDVPRLRGLVDELADCITIKGSESGTETLPSLNSTVRCIPWRSCWSPSSSR